MGIAASAVRNKVKRPFRHYNAEERAMKVISKSKPTPAPPHPSMRKIMADIMKDPTKLQSSRTDPKLLESLSKVYITSAGENAEIISTRRNLPTDRAQSEMPLFGFEDPKVIPPGKATLRQLLDAITKHSEDPDNYTVDETSKKYNIDIVDTFNILEHYKSLLVFHNPKPAKPKEKNPFKRLQSGIDRLKE